MERDGWRIYSPRYEPDASLEGHLTFALKHEGLDLAVVKRLFAATGPAPIADLVKAKPTGAYARRVWFLYEWLTETRLELPNADRGAYAPIVDPDQQYAVPAATSSRHRVKNNLPGTPGFLSAGVPHGSAGAPYRYGPAGARAGSRCRRAARSAGAHGRFPAPQGFEVKFRHRGRASPAGPHPAMGTRYRPGRPAADRS